MRIPLLILLYLYFQQNLCSINNQNIGYQREAKQFVPHTAGDDCGVKLLPV